MVHNLPSGTINVVIGMVTDTCFNFFIRTNDTPTQGRMGKKPHLSVDYTGCRPPNQLDKTP